MSMSLRNEPREPDDDLSLNVTAYNWEDWYEHVKSGVAAIHTANPDVLIFLSGLDFDTYLTPVVQGTALTPGNATFDRADFGSAGADKLVLELHNYQKDATSCATLEADLYEDGFEALTPAAANMFPVLMTEWGFAMDATTWQGVYASCLTDYLPAQKAGWMMWVIAGSYYIREGTQDYDETWGLLNHDWSDWRQPEYVQEALIPMIKKTLS